MNHEAPLSPSAIEKSEANLHHDSTRRMVDNAKKATG
jgi:hypothetical protein